MIVVIPNVPKIVSSAIKKKKKYIKELNEVVGRVISK